MKREEELSPAVIIGDGDAPPKTGDDTDSERGGERDRR